MCKLCVFTSEDAKRDNKEVDVSAKIGEREGDGG